MSLRGIKNQQEFIKYIFEQSVEDPSKQNWQVLEGQVTDELSRIKDIK